MLRRRRIPLKNKSLPHIIKYADNLPEIQKHYRAALRVALSVDNYQLNVEIIFSSIRTFNLTVAGAFQVALNKLQSIQYSILRQTTRDLVKLFIEGESVPVQQYNYFHTIFDFSLTNFPNTAHTTYLYFLQQPCRPNYIYNIHSYLIIHVVNQLN
ncbi:Hypothetical_protein [Hexamita inflata]|uniref:Hypothetical_protein n=1 Tax=Hexamita inflata TaxID=28002 RepID=A0AA86QFR0_9EUKA|nr:Hypothetical protein HINF_LOCUS43092 [Hexamita inflata]CAI9955450.1 Hypothetical protein HINF_LOCUS43095 [Hexamita inflata]